MARVTVEDCVEKTFNRFSLVLLASKRAKQLERGVRPGLASRASNKCAVNALREIAAGYVKFKVDESHQSAVEQMESDLNR